jgi:hypothetical protein
MWREQNKKEIANRAYGREYVMQFQSNGLDEEENVSVVVNINCESDISNDVINE